MLQETARNAPHEDNEVNWYLTPGTSFGFAPAGARIRQTKADSTSGSDDDKRLSWHIDDEDAEGGYRAGDLRGLNDDDNWMKLLFYK